MRRERMSTIWPVCFMIVVGLKINVLLDMCKFTFFFGEEKGKADVFLLFIPIIISVPLRLGLHRFLHIGEACFQFVEFLVPFQVELHCEFYFFIHCYFLSFCYI